MVLMDFGGSISAIIITCLVVIAVKYKVPEVAALGSVLCGATLGFLIFNLHPAKIFMGDTGSLLLGGAIVVMALYLINTININTYCDYSSTWDNICNTSGSLL